MEHDIDSQNSPRLWGRIRVGTALALGFGTLIFLAISIVLAVSLWSGRETSRDLLQDQISVSVDLLENQVRDHLDPAARANSDLAELISSGAIGLKDYGRLVPMMRGVMATAPQVSAMALIYPDAKLIRFARIQNRFRLRSSNWSENPDILNMLAFAKTHKKPYWGIPFWSEELKATLLNHRAPIFRNGQFAGVLIMAVRVSDLSRFLASIDDKASRGKSFLLYGEDLVLAHSNMASGLYPRAKGAALPATDQVADLVLARIWDKKSQRPGVPIKDGKTTLFLMDLLDTTFTVVHRPLEGYGEKNLVVGRYDTLDSRFGVFTRLVQAGISGLVVLVIALIAAFVLGRVMAGRLHSLAEGAEKVRILDLEPPPVIPRSHLRELDDTAHAFNAMVSGVRRLGTYVPHSLVRDLVKPGGKEAVISAEREVTVLFTDIRDFTRQSENMPADQIAAFLNHHFTLLAQCIEDEEGTIDKYIGDSIMAFWGAPHPSEDHADRACRAALAIRKTIEQDNEIRVANGLQPVRMGIGIHCGRVIAGNIGAPGRINYTLVGDTVNTAQRLEQLCKSAGQSKAAVKILVSVEVARKLTGHYNAIPAGTHEVRGRFNTVDVFEIS